MRGTQNAMATELDYIRALKVKRVYEGQACNRFKQQARCDKRSMKTSVAQQFVDPR